VPAKFQLFFLGILLTITGPIFAQNLFIRGRVVDATGAVVPGVVIQLSTPAGVSVAQTQSDSAGNFTLPNLHSGNFVLTAPAARGFAEQSAPIHLAASIPDFAIHLTLAALKQEITVPSDWALSTEPSANRDTIVTTGDQLRKLPVFDQDFIGALTPFLDAASGSSGGTTIIVDGVEMKSAGVSASAIQEVRVNNDPYSAEFTRPGRGRIEIITKPGTPNFHGEGNFLFLDSALNANSFPAIVKPQKLREIYEGHLSGPVGRGTRTSFISSGSFRLRNASVVVDATGVNGTILENVLAPTRDAQATARVTHDFAANHRLSLGYNYESFYATNGSVGGLFLPEAGINTQSREDDAILNDRIIVTPNLINQLQITLEKDEDVNQSVTHAQSIQVSGAFIGGGAQADLNRTENTIHVNEVLSWSHGKHYLRAGVQLPQFSRRAVDDQTNRLGTFSFSSLATYAANTPYAFTAQQGPGRAIYWINEFGSFIQDQIKLNAHTQVSLGLRYDWQTFLPDNNNLAPRVSLAYAPGKGKTILRTGAGVFYDRTGGDFPATVVLHNGAALRTIQILNPPYPHTVGLSDASIPPSIVRFDPHVRAPYAIQYSLGAEHQVTPSLTVTAAYRGQVQIKSFRSRDANAPILPPNPDPNFNYPRPNPTFGKIQQIESGGRTLLNALDVSFRSQNGRWFTGQAQYTLSRFEGNTGGINWFPQNQYQPNSEWARSTQDSRHRLNLIGNINPDHLLTLGVNVILYSGTPYNETTGVDFFHTGLGNARPAGIGRNTLQGATTAELDLSYAHDFYLTKARDEKARVFSAEFSAFNVLNHTNYTDYIGTVTAADPVTLKSRFMQPTSALPGRQLQFAIGYRF
jgi:Carboxypeptidase regulatory-like domain